jgi:hypothetical protein
VVGTVAAGVAVTGGAVVVGTVAGAVVAAVTAAVTGCEAGAAGFDTRATEAVEPPAKAATVPPAPPRTATIATPVSTIPFLMDRRLRPAHQPVVNTGATLSPSVHSGPVDLQEIEAIRQLKYRYFRFLDTKRFTELGQLLTDDATSAYQSGELSYNGRDAIVAFLEESLGNADIVTMHNGHHPEIELTGPDTATGVWYLEDRVVVRAMDLEIVGTLLYDDRYVKVDGQWKIQHTGYDRIFEEHRRFSDGQLHTFRAMFDAK